MTDTDTDATGRAEPRGRLASVEAREAWKAQLATPLSGRRAIVAIAPLAALTKRVALLRAYGAPPPLAIAVGTGAGAVPAPDHALVVQVQMPALGSMTDDLRRHDSYLRHDLPQHALDAIDRYDPGREAWWLVTPFIDTEPLLGRPVLGGRPRAWRRLEDKMTVDRIWDAVGVDRAPSVVVPVDTEQLGSAHARLDAGAGTVWAGDARDGFNGGGDFTRWVVTAEDRARAVDFFAPRCDAVRVMPFLDGVPCSIHGCVLPDGTATFRPLELAILRGPTRLFVYGGQGTTWDPPAEDREAMRALARRAGEHLRATAGYRGFFGIDGVLTAEGFRPTELNFRFSGGVASMAGQLDFAAFDLLQIALVAGQDPGVTVADLEEWAVPALDATRFAKAIAFGAVDGGSAVESLEIPVRWDGHRLHRVEPGDTGAWTVEVGDTSSGVFIRLAPADPPPGLPLGVLNVALMRFADAELGTGFGPVEPAPDVRAR